jgi:hypothetical protein
MIIRNSHCVIFSQSSNTHYWEQDRFPAWTRFVAIRHFSDQRIGGGVEPHYHDCMKIPFSGVTSSAYRLGDRPC